MNRTNMNKHFIPYKEATILKKLGFDEECFASYLYIESFENGSEIILERYHSTKESFTPAPLWSQAIGWLQTKLGMKGIMFTVDNKSNLKIVRELITKLKKYDTKRSLR